MRDKFRSTSERVRSLHSTPHTYRLKFSEDSRGVAKDIEFEAHDAARALIIAQMEASNRSAELWCDGQKLCSISRTLYGAWQIGATGPKDQLCDRPPLDPDLGSQSPEMNREGRPARRVSPPFAG
jgi:hypothetical protein